MLTGSTARRRQGAVVLLNVNVLVAAQTDGHVNSRMAGVIERPSLDEEFFNYSSLRLVWNGN
jgi:hypothetical protein